MVAYSDSLCPYMLSMTLEIALHCSVVKTDSPASVGAGLVSVVSIGVGLVDALSAAIFG